MDYDDGVTVSSRFTRSARSTGNGRNLGNPASMYGRPPSLSLAQQIQSLETDAYFAVLRAFGAQSDVISWDKERLMSQLRRELNVDDSLHSDMLERVHGDPKIQQIRALKSQGLVDFRDASPPLDIQFGSGVSRKKQKISAGAHPPTKAELLHPSGRRSLSKGKLKKGKMDIEIDPWIGRRVKTRWTENDGRSTFYEAVITDYAPDKGYALVYDMNTPDETFEWVDLKKLPKQDLIWVDAPPVTLDKIVPSVTPAKQPRGGRKSAPRTSHAAQPRSKSYPSAPTPVKSHYVHSESISDQNSHEIENGRHAKTRHGGEFTPVEKIFAIDRIEAEDDFVKLQKAHDYAEEKAAELKRKLADIGDSSDDDDETDRDESAHPSRFNKSGRDEDERSVQGSPVRNSDSNRDRLESPSNRNERDNSSNSRGDSIAQEDGEG